jgi:hypothetical protein
VFAVDLRTRGERKLGQSAATVICQYRSSTISRSVVHARQAGRFRVRKDIWLSVIFQSTKHHNSLTVRASFWTVGAAVETIPEYS